MKRTAGVEAEFSDDGTRKADISPSHFSVTSSEMPGQPLQRNSSSTSREGPDTTSESETLRRDRSKIPPRTGIGRDEGEWEDGGESGVPIVKSSPFREPLR